MARKRIKMKKIREVLRLHFECKLSNRQIGSAVRKSKGSVFNCLNRFKEAGLSWPLPEQMTDSELETKLYPQIKEEGHGKSQPDFDYIHQEMSRPHVTMELLWEEYRQTHPEGLSRSSFYRHYRQYRKVLPVDMKGVYKGGDKLFVDYSGKKLQFYDRSEERFIEVEVFVASWAASSLCYCEASLSQTGKDWVSSHVRAMEYSGCVPAVIIPDNLKSAVTKANFYEPDINVLYGKFAEHYDTAILPARVKKPKDKPVVESNVLHLQRFIFGRLRNRTFFSLAELNEAIWQALELFNNRPMQQYKKTRKERFELLDKPYAKKLPGNRFIFTQVKTDVRVAPNYHIQFEKHFYSVPYEFVRKRVDVYQIGSIIEIYHNTEHVCRHKAGPASYDYTTKDEHMPPKHKFVKGWSAEWITEQAHKIGPTTTELVKKIMAGKRHPEQGFRAAMGVLNLKKIYPAERIEKASGIALSFGNLSLKGMKSILSKELDKSKDREKAERKPVLHENIRGLQYYN